MKVVLDTNVIVSGLNFPGNERQVLVFARRERFELYLSPFILKEVAGVLKRKFGWDEHHTARAIRMLRSRATVFEPRQRVSILEHNEPDNRILECAKRASADYLVTGDRRHLLPLKEFEGTQIVTAAQLLALLGEA